MGNEGNLKWIQEQPHEKPPAVSQPGVPKARRTHTKSRHGCDTCKRRRKKCDEMRPMCGQCQHMRIHCAYLPRYQDRPVAIVSHGKSQYSMSRQYTRNEVIGLLKADIIEGIPSSARYSRVIHVDYLRLLDHFISDETPWVGPPECQKVLQKHGVQLGTEAPHLLYAIMAFSASHIDYLHPDRRSRVTAVHQYDRLLQLYSAQLHHLDTANVTPLYGSCNLLTMMSYLGVAYDNPDPYYIKPEEHTCDWGAFRSLQGIRVLQSAPELREQLKNSVWLPALRERELECAADIVTCSQPTWSLRTMQEFAAVCGVSPDLQDGDIVFLEALRGLNRLIHRRMDETKIGQLLQFVVNLSSAFMDSAEQLDARAMLVLCYWHALMIKAGQWWIIRTAVGACRRSCDYLWKVGGEDIRQLLRFPAAQCGFDLEVLEPDQYTLACVADQRTRSPVLVRRRNN